MNYHRLEAVAWLPQSVPLQDPRRGVFLMSEVPLKPGFMVKGVGCGEVAGVWDLGVGVWDLGVWGFAFKNQGLRTPRRVLLRVKCVFTGSSSTHFF